MITPYTQISIAVFSMVTTLPDGYRACPESARVEIPFFSCLLASRSAIYTTAQKLAVIRPRTKEKFHECEKTEKIVPVQFLAMSLALFAIRVFAQELVARSQLRRTVDPSPRSAFGTVLVSIDANGKETFQVNVRDLGQDNFSSFLLRGTNLYDEFRFCVRTWPLWIARTSRRAIGHVRWRVRIRRRWIFLRQSGIWRSAAIPRSMFRSPASPKSRLSSPT